MSKYPSQTQDKFTVRFPDGMRDEIAKRAEKNGRSMNAEIVQILDDALSNRGNTSYEPVDMDKISFTVDELNRITNGIKEALIHEFEQNFIITKKEKN